MVTTLSIILVVLIVFNVWLASYTIKRERARRKLLQERMNECDKALGETINELGLAKQHLNEAKSANAALKRSFEETVHEYERLQRDYSKLADDFATLKKSRGKGVLLVDEKKIPKGKTFEDIAEEWKNFKVPADTQPTPKARKARQPKKK